MGNDLLGIEIGAFIEANAAGFKPIRETEKDFTAQEFAEWLRVLAHKANSTGLAIKADEYAHKIVEEDEINSGWLLLRAKESYWDFLKPAHRIILEEKGFDREPQTVIRKPSQAETEDVVLHAPTPQVPGIFLPGMTTEEAEISSPALDARGMNTALQGYRHEQKVPTSSSAMGSEIAEALISDMTAFAGQLQVSPSSNVVRSLAFLNSNPEYNPDPNPNPNGHGHRS